MAELGWDSRYTLPQILKLVRNNTYEKMANVLTENNDMLKDMPIFAGNGILSNTGSRETSLPTPQIVKVGDGWDASVVQWNNFVDTISLFKDRFDVPLDVYNLQPNKAQWRADTEDRHVEGFGQGVQNHIVYGTSTATPEKFDGLAVRYNTPDSGDPTNPSSTGDPFVFDAGGGTGADTTSIWLIQWGPMKVYGITPINDPMMGLKRIDRGMQEVTAENSKTRTDLRTNFEWKLGICVHDVRSVARIRNVPTSVTGIVAFQTAISRVIQAREEVFKGNEPVWMYTNKRVRYLMKEVQKEKMNLMYDKNNPWQIPMMRFDDMPMRTVEAILNTETGVAAADRKSVV